jgi:hypothetical protein
MLVILRKCCVDEKKKAMVINVVKQLLQYLPTADELKTIIRCHESKFKENCSIPYSIKVLGNQYCTFTKVEIDINIWSSIINTKIFIHD